MNACGVQWECSLPQSTSTGCTYWALQERDLLVKDITISTVAQVSQLMYPCIQIDAGLIFCKCPSPEDFLDTTFMKPLHASDVN